MPHTNQLCLLVRVSVWIVCAISPLTSSSQTFTNATEEFGISDQMSVWSTYGSGITVIDIDSDGWDDIVFPRSGIPPVLYHNLGGTFERILLPANTSDIKQILFADYDNDGDQDMVWIAYNGPHRLWQQVGFLQFADVTFSSGLIIETNPKGYGACWGDLNADGWLDLYICSYNGTPNRLYMNEGNGHFTEMAQATGLHNGSPTLNFPFQSVMIDIDLDNDQDLLVVNDRPPIDGLFIQEDSMQFSNIAATSGFNHYVNSMSASLCDFDKDGDYDVYVTNTPELGNYLFRNNGNLQFQNVAPNLGATVGLNGWGALWIDMDHDTWDDLYVANTASGSVNPNTALRNVQGYFEPWLDYVDSIPLMSSYGVAKGDFNRDGYPDIAVAGTGAPFQVFLNNGGENHWINVTLNGVQSNRDGIGARIEYFLGGQRIIKSTMAGENYCSQNSQHYLLSLGEAARVDSLRVFWTSGWVDTFYDMPSDQRYVLQEGHYFSGHLEQTGDFTLCENEVEEVSVLGAISVWWNDQTTGTNRSISNPGIYGAWWLDDQGLMHEMLPVEFVGIVAPSIEVQSSNPSCAGRSDGMIQLVISEQVEALWEDGAIGNARNELQGGTYAWNVSYSDDCIVHGEVYLTNPDTLVFTFSYSEPRCFGEASGAVSVNTIEGGTPLYTVQLIGNEGGIISWDQLTSGEYTLIVTDENGCEALSELWLSEPFSLSVEIEQGDQGVIAIAEGGTPPHAFFWNEVEGTLISGPLDPGVHHLKVVDSNACEIEMDFEIDIPDSIDLLDPMLECLRQSQQQLRWQCGGSVRKFQLLDTTGRCIAMDRSNAISLESLSPGVYIVTVELDYGVQVSHKIHVLR